MADMNIDKSKIDAFQKIVQSDPKAIEKLMGQITPDHISAALNLFSSLDTKTQSTIGNIIQNLKPGETKK